MSKRKHADKNQKNKPSVVVAETEVDEDIEASESEDVDTEEMTNEEAQKLVDSGEATIPDEALISNATQAETVVKKALVNMTLHNGKNLEIGKPIELTHEEHAELLKHHLGPAVEE